MLIHTAPYKKPALLIEDSFLNSDNYRIRYATMRADGPEKAQLVLMGGQTNYIELYYEIFYDLSRQGFTAHFLERSGDGGSERQYPNDLELPPTHPIDYHVNDISFFMNNIAALDKSTPIGMVTDCLGGLVGLHYLKAHPESFDFSVLISPMFGLASNFANTAEKEINFVHDFYENKETMCQYISKNGAWSAEKLQKYVNSGFYTHHTERPLVDQEWQNNYPNLRMGGFTYGNAAANIKGVTDLLEPHALETIRSPITILSGSDDLANRIDRHHEWGKRLPNAEVIDIVGGRHELWFENAEFRDVIFDCINHQTVACKPQ